MENRTRFWDFLYQLTDWIMRFAVINFYWFLFNIPLLLILIIALWSPVPIGLLYYGIALFLAVPLLSFPATASLFATVREWVFQREQQSLTKTYFRHFKENYKQSMGAGFIFTVLWLIWVGDIYYSRSTQNQMFFISFLIIGAILFVWTVNYFSFQAHFHERLNTLLKNSFFLTIGRPLASLAILFIGLSLFYVSFFKLLFMIPFFTFSLLAYFSFQMFYFVQKRIRENTS